MKKEEALKHYGSATKLAQALGVTPQAVGQWGEEVPLLRQYQLERLTHGRLKADTPKITPPMGQAQRA